MLKCKKVGAIPTWTCYCGLTFDLQFPVQFDARDEHTKRCLSYRKRFSFLKEPLPLLPSPFTRPKPATLVVNARLGRKAA